MVHLLVGMQCLLCTGSVQENVLRAHRYITGSGENATRAQGPENLGDGENLCWLGVN